MRMLPSSLKMSQESSETSVELSQREEKRREKKQRRRLRRSIAKFDRPRGGFRHVLAAKRWMENYVEHENLRPTRPQTAPVRGRNMGR